MTTKVCVLAAAGVAIGSANPALAGFTRVSSNFSGMLQAETDLVGGSRLQDQREIRGGLEFFVSDNIPSGPASLDRVFEVDSQIGNIGGGGTAAFDAMFSEDSVHFSVEINGFASGQTQTGDRGQFETFGNFALNIDLDDAELVEFILTVELVEVDSDVADVLGRVSASGLPGGLLTTDADENDGEVLREVRATRLIDRGGFGLRGDWNAALFPNDESEEIGPIRVSVEARIIPAPAGVLALVGAGLLAARRRR